MPRVRERRPNDSRDYHNHLEFHGWKIRHIGVELRRVRVAFDRAGNSVGIERAKSLMLTVDYLSFTHCENLRSGIRRVSQSPERTFEVS